MKRTTLYLDPELEVLLKLEMLRQNRPMAEIVREAVAEYVGRSPGTPPPGAGEFASGRRETAEDVDAALAATGFGGAPPAPDPGARPAPRRPRTKRR